MESVLPTRVMPGQSFEGFLNSRADSEETAQAAMTEDIMSLFASVYDAKLAAACSQSDDGSDENRDGRRFYRLHFGKVQKDSAGSSLAQTGKEILNFLNHFGAQVS